MKKRSRRFPLSFKVFIIDQPYIIKKCRFSLWETLFSKIQAIFRKIDLKKDFSQREEVGFLPEPCWKLPFHVSDYPFG